MVHQYKLNGFNIVIDVYSGSVHVVDDVAYDIIQLFCDEEKETIIEKMLDKYADEQDITREELEEVFDDIEELKKQRKLFTDDIYEPNASDLKNRHTEVKALCLHVAHTCNLNCTYCFASQGNFNGERGLMSFETGKRALDFLIENSGDRRNLEVDFFGGEPLMNFDVVKELVTYARSIEKEKGKNFRFTLTTNGVGVNDEVIQFANKECHNVVMSIDGRKEVHDRLRKDYQGNGSYDVIVPKFQEFARIRTSTENIENGGHSDYYVRGTYTHANTDFTEDIFHLADLGFSQLSMEPVVCTPDDPDALTEDDMAVLCRQYEILAEEMLKRKKEGHPITFYHYMLDLTHGPCIHKRIAGCGSGTEYFAVTPWGDLYPCHQFVGDEKYLMGNIWDGVTNTDVQENFRRCNVYARKECDDCWARLYCSGGCAANAYHASGDITGVYDYGCRLFRKRMECAIMLQIAERKEL